MAGAPPTSPEDFTLPQSPARTEPAPPSPAEPVPGEIGVVEPGPEAPVSLPGPTAPSVANALEDSSAERTAIRITPPPDDWVGRTIAGFEIVSRLGQGGMGVVYKGRQVSLDRTVAIKVLSKALSDNQEFIKRFEREAKSIARLNHPNIVGVYDFGHFEGTWFMVSEFVEGVSLATMIADKVMLNAEELQPIMVQCLTALASVSATGVVHRDIKPDNIIITRDGVAKLLDFGLAKDVSGTGDSTDLTGSGLAMGTPAYMSPEQCMGRKLDGRSDIYALGVTAYFALTGEKPFVGQSSFEVMTKQREYNPPPPHELNPRLQPECAQLVMRMLAKNPTDRFPDAESCRQAWDRLTLRPRSSPSGLHQISRSPDPAPNRQSGIGLPNLGELLPAPVVGAATSATSNGVGSPLIAAPAAAAISARAPRQPENSGRRSDPTEVERASRVGSEIRRSTKGEPQPCPKCGHINRLEAASCVRCLASLRTTEVISSKAILPEAERLMEQELFAEAASLFARLADGESDRKVRSVLRSKEREARQRALERHEHQHINRAQSQAQRGDLRGALNTIAEAQAQLPRDAGSSSVGSGLDALAADVRSRLQYRSRRRWLVVAAVAIGTIVAAVLIWKVLHG